MSDPSQSLSADTIINETTRSGSSTVPGVSRSTVLPRVEWEGQVPKVKPSERTRFEELGLLGEGGMGEVALAKDHDIDREVALKRLPASTDLGRVMRFVEEIRTVGRLEHPNIMPVHDVGVDDAGRYYFVMRKLEGETLEKVIARLAARDPAAQARFTIEARIQVFLGVLNAMGYAHQRGIIHRDLKPANIMIGPHGEVTVMDWGLARAIRGVDRPASTEARPLTSSREGTVLQTQDGATIGTPMYMSPEQARGENDRLDERSDVYSLSVLFHELLHARHYLEGRHSLTEVLHGVLEQSPPIHDRAIGERVPAELDWFIERGMRKDKAERSSSVAEMEAELHAILRGECRVQCPRTAYKRTLNGVRKAFDEHPNQVMAATIAVGALSLVSFGFSAWMLLR